MAALYGRRLRKGAVTAAVAAAAVAALSASQAPGITDTPQGRKSTATPPAEDTATGNSPYYTDLPPLNSPTRPDDDAAGDGDGAGDPAPGAAEAGIPATLLDAYMKAESALAQDRPGCKLPWELLAAIGKVESGQARGGRVDKNGTTLAPILGPQLNGNGFARITDTDGGNYDGDTTHDRAVGPMQFIPSTWASWGRDGNGDGSKDPNNIYDAALAAGHYLCAGDRDLSTKSGLHQAILSYNHSRHYLRTVLAWLDYYRKGTHPVPDGTGVLPDHRSDDAKAKPGPRPAPGATDRPQPGPSEGAKPAGDGTGPSGPGGSGESTAPADPADASDPADSSDPSGSTEPTWPSSPTDPSTPAPEKPVESSPGDGSGSSTPAPAPEDRVARLADAGTGEVTATAGTAFDVRPMVQARDADGAGVAEVKVVFEIVGDTDSRFGNGTRTASALTKSTGKVTAPAFTAGEQTGEFTVRAKVAGRSLPAVDHTATVTARQADALSRVGDETLSCESGASYADPVEVRATFKGAAASGVELTATMIKSAEDPTVNDKGPYFKAADGSTVRTLKGLKTGADGRLTLPKIYADGAAGTYLLRVDAVGGGSVTIELKVA